MPYANEETGNINTKLYVYMEALKNPEETPYFCFSEYDRKDMILVHTFDLEFTPDLSPGFTVPASIEKLRARAVSFMEMAAEQQEAIENLLALPAPCDHNWLTLPNGADQCTHCHVTATQADVPLR